MLPAQAALMQDKFMMERLVILAVISLSFSLGNPPSCDAKSNLLIDKQCFSDAKRVECGYVGINQQQCEERDCCWSPANNQPWCFQKSTMVPDEEAGEIASSIKEVMSRYLTKHGSPSAFDSAASRIQADGQCSPDDTRVDCGYFGINQQQCEDSGCCWSPTNKNHPWCFQRTVSSEQCFPDNARTECGYYGIDQQQCEADGCCWNPAENKPWCFKKTSAAPVNDPQCSVNAPRVDCGALGTTQQQCEQQGCCWNPDTNQPWCFHKSIEVSGPQQCSPDEPRVDCGQLSTTLQQCVQMGCCWSPADNKPWCFKKSTSPPSTPTCLPNDVRYDCGYVGVTQQKCEDKGCCWSPASDQPYCFFKTGGPEPSLCKNNGPRYDCGIVGTDETDCARRGCCWDPKVNEPWCFYQSPRYVVESSTPTSIGVKMTLKVAANSVASLPFGTNISPLTFELSKEKNDRLHIKITDPNNKRWEVPTNVLPVPAPPSSAPSSPSYTYHLPGVGQEFYFAVSRSSNQETIFNTSIVGPLQFGDQYISISTSLPDNYNMYGLGERKSHLKITPRQNGENCGNYYPMFNADIPTIPENFNLYGSHPFYMEMRKGGLAHGVFLRNSDPMDVILSDNALQYKIIGGVLDFYFFLGPEPESVVQQYTEVIGRPFMPAYWTLGFHQCRYGYETLDQLKEVVRKYGENKIPLDTIWSDIDYMDGYRDFTLDPHRFPANSVKDFLNSLHQNNQHYAMIVDPGIKIDKGYPAYDRGLAQDVFLKDYNGNNFVGLVWPGSVHYPDFFNPKAEAYWQQEFKDFFDNLVNADGIWLDMNEAANFCDGLCSTAAEIEVKYPFMLNGKDATMMGRSPNFNANNPPYAINNRCYKVPLYTRTLAMDAVYHGDVLEYDAHNLYGFMQAIATYHMLENLRPGVRPFVLGRANFAGTGSYAAHWNGDNTADETDLYFSIPMMLSFQLFGMPFVGSDICGFFENTNEELCARWMELGSFYPFARNHNFKGPIPQEPYNWPTVANVSRKYLAIRYSLLPYYYTLFYKAHRKVDSANPPAATIVRPLFFEFPQDTHTYPIDWQFMLGSALLFTPVLRVGVAGKSVFAYFPPARWYDWFTYNVTSSSGSESITISTPLDHLPIHIRGGSIIPLQDPALTTTDSRAKDYSLLVALDSHGEASGDVFLDDGISISLASYTFVEYTVSNKHLQASVSGTGYASHLPPLDRITILGVATTPTTITMNGQAVAHSFNSRTNSLLVGPGLRMGMDRQYTVSWS